MILFGNPEFKRLLRSKLRTRALVSYGTAAALIFGGVLTFMYFVEKERFSRMNFSMLANAFSTAMARVMHEYFFTACGIQMAMVTLYGAALAAQNITLEKERGTFDFQRLVAMGARRLTLGKLFGAPAEAFLMALVGVPFVLAACLGSDIPFSLFLQAEIAVFLYGLLASAFGLLCSSVVEKTAHATGITVLLGIPFYSLFVNWDGHALWATANPIHLFKAMTGRYYTFDSETFRFCGMDVPLFAGFVLTNTLFIVLYAMITARRIAEVELSFMTPRQGLLCFTILQALLIADVASQRWVYTLSMQYYHGVNMAALMLLAFALTPGAELVRGRVFRGQRNEHWKIVFERTNRLQDSPALRAMLEVCGLYIVFSLLFAALVLPKITAGNAHYLWQNALLTAMNASLGIAAAGLLLYIQVYTERGCFKLGMAFIALGFVIPPLAIWVGYLLKDAVKIDYVLRVSPVAYLIGLNDLARNDSELACPLACVVIAGTFCALAAMRVRFLLDMEEIMRERQRQREQSAAPAAGG